MKSDKKGKPAAKKDGWTKSWAKIFLVMACILFAGVMIITSLGSNWLVTMKPAKTGDTAVVDVTIRDADGRPVLTTNERIYETSFQKGDIVWLTGPLTLTVNSTTTEMISPIPVYRHDYGEASFGLFGPELNQITASLAGMKQGGTRKIVFTDNDHFQREMNPEQFAQIGGNYSTAMPGDQLLLAFTTTPMINVDDNSTVQYAFRTSLITGKTGGNVTVSYGYPSADISIVRLNSG
jgi:hypothetical protein